MKTRETKYTTQIVDVIARLGHATNAEILNSVQSMYPEVSATTIHRVTARLVERGYISEAPSDANGSMRFDANNSPHDHFTCTNCGGIRDVDIADEVIPKISKELGGCKITGRLVIYGSCEKCLIHTREV
jgi:Fur family peroxide stress response transcriptional regulator